MLWLSGRRGPDENERLFPFEMTRSYHVVTPYCRGNDIIRHVQVPGTQNIAEPARDKPKTCIGNFKRTVEHTGKDRTNPIS